MAGSYRKKSKSKRKTSYSTNNLSLVWLFSGMFLGVLGVIFVYALYSKQWWSLNSFKEYKTAHQTEKLNREKQVQVTVPKVNKPKEPQYEFYTLLPGMEVPLPENSSKDKSAPVATVAIVNEREMAAKEHARLHTNQTNNAQNNAHHTAQHNGQNNANPPNPAHHSQNDAHNTQINSQNDAQINASQNLSHHSSHPPQNHTEIQLQAEVSQQTLSAEKKLQGVSTTNITTANNSTNASRMNSAAVNKTTNAANRINSATNQSPNANRMNTAAANSTEVHKSTTTANRINPTGANKAHSMGVNKSTNPANRNNTITANNTGLNKSANLANKNNPIAVKTTGMDKSNTAGNKMIAAGSKMKAAGNKQRTTANKASTKVLPKVQNRMAAPQYILQAGIFRELQAASALKANLNAQGFNAHIQNVKTDQGQSWFRVTLGPFAAEPMALQQKNRLEKQKIQATLILQRPPNQ